MSNLVYEILLRLVKPLVTAVLAVVVYAVLAGPLGQQGSPQLALICWLSAAAFILLVQEGPI
jgi:hypothetical protein